MAKSDLDIRQTFIDLGFSEEFVTDINFIYEQPDAQILENRARIALALRQIAEKVMESTKAEARERIGPEKEFRFELKDDYIRISWRPEQNRQTVNTKWIRANYPPEEYPSLYKDSVVNPFIVVAAI